MIIYLKSLYEYLITIFNKQNIIYTKFNFTEIENNTLQINEILDILNKQTEFEIETWMIYYIIEHYDGFKLLNNKELQYDGNKRSI